MENSEFPALYRSAGKLSEASQRKFFRALIAHLVFLTTAAALSVVNHPSSYAALTQAVVMLAALACSIYLFSTRPEKIWYSARALAESIKTLSWRYVCKAEPFQTADEVSRAAFVKKLKDVLKQNIDLAGKFTDHLDEAQLTSAMEKHRADSLEMRKKRYRDCRISDQLSWYTEKSRVNGNKAAIFFATLIVLNVLAILFALGKISYPAAPYWPTDIFIAAGACVLTWMQAKRFSELSAAYALAAVEINLVSLDALKPQTLEEFSEFVGDAENAFSREHTQWVARKDR
ncbi:MAG: DUF4231 domain-containing protein [Polaromonas sp.]|uniref:DUF4231 domain-containing protein n=1 Tax=Polaromonas sp. TaxID=1869339 RepID=UPI002487FCE2|nr:DUF4231 domain-containing protein [Polaromonas sp.]MDI1267552.1 DUF4231 domain-containing protein [Polaromonas sp.]